MVVYEVVFPFLFLALGFLVHFFFLSPQKIYNEIKERLPIVFAVFHRASHAPRYWLRWVNTRGEKGPWSEPVSATVPG